MHHDIAITWVPRHGVTMVTCIIYLHCIIAYRVAVSVPLLRSVCFLPEQLRVSSFNLRFGRFCWCFLAVDVGLFFRWGVGSAHCICLHRTRAGLGLRERRRFGEEIKKGTLLCHVSQRVSCNVMLNYSKKIIHLYSIPTDPELSCSAELFVEEMRVRGKTPLAHGKGRGGARQVTS